jgi:hypothetical protein
MQLIHVALRVLACYTAGKLPDAEDVRILNSATGSGTTISGIDALAVEVVERELRRLKERRARGENPGLVGPYG